jgi:3-dehydroquinate dehydratase, type I
MTQLVYPAAVGTVTKNVGESSQHGKELGADILEIRFDLLLKNVSAETDEMIENQLISWIKEAKEANLPIIGTLRASDEGGAFVGSEEERFRFIQKIIPNVDFMDIEQKSSIQNILKCRETAEKSKTKIILSSHFFNDTPSAEKLKEIIQNSFEKGADISKVAVMPKTAGDVLKLYQAGLEFETNKNSLCLIAMGEIGKQTRIAAPLYGSVLSYGYIDEVAAPGQLRVDEIKTGFKLLGF